MTKLALLAAAAVAATAALMAAPASAQDASNNIYANLGYTQFNTDRGDCAVTGRLGYQFTPYLSAEGEYSTGVNDLTKASSAIPGASTAVSACRCRRTSIFSAAPDIRKPISMAATASAIVTDKTSATALPACNGIPPPAGLGSVANTRG